MTEDVGLLLVTEPLLQVDFHIKGYIDEYVCISFNVLHLYVHV